MTQLATTDVKRPQGRQGGPPPLVPAVIYGVLVIAALVTLVHAPRSTADAARILTYDQTHHATMTFAGFLIFAASAPLLIWTATIYRRLRTLGVTAPGAVIALSGGLLASMSLAMSGVFTWVAGQVHPAGEAGLAKALSQLSFATGGVGFVVPLGLLLAGTAVPSLLLGFGPRWLAWAGLVVAAISMLSTFTMLTPVFDFTLPIGRFGGLIWLIVVSVTMPPAGSVD